MLKHYNKIRKIPNRVVILGSGGFVSSSTERRLKNLNIKLICLSHSALDLTKSDSSSKLLEILKPGDTIFFAAARAPVKNEDMLIENMIMCKNVCKALKKITVKHLRFFWHFR